MTGKADSGGEPQARSQGQQRERQEVHEAGKKRTTAIQSRAVLGDFHCKPCRLDMGLRFCADFDIFFRTVFVYFIVELGSRRIVHYGVTR